MAKLRVDLIINPGDDTFDTAEVRIQDHESIYPERSGNLCVVDIDGLYLHAPGDGANTLADGLEHLAAKVRASHRDWLRGKATAALGDDRPLVDDAYPAGGVDQ